MKRESVIFICTYNSVRSPIAEGLLNKRAVGRYDIFSAGVAPIRINPYAVRVMDEWGINISGHHPISVYTYTDKEFDYVITLCDQARASLGRRIPEGNRMFHHPFVTPSEIGRDREDILVDFRKLRNDLDEYLGEIFPNLDPVLHKPAGPGESGK